MKMDKHTWTFKGCPVWRSLSSGASSQVTPLRVLVDHRPGPGEPTKVLELQGFDRPAASSKTKSNPASAVILDQLYLTSHTSLLELINLSRTGQVSEILR